MIGFTGSRSLPAQYQSLVTQVVRHFAGQPVAVGCAGGADEFVRLAAPSAQVFRAASFPGPARAQLVQRSIAMVQAVAASPSPLLIGFVAGPCSAGIVPAHSWRSGSPPSGSWSSLALGAGLGLPVIVFWCAENQPQLPASWGQWQPVNLAGCAGWQLQPVTAQLALF